MVHVGHSVEHVSRLMHMPEIVPSEQSHSSVCARWQETGMMRSRMVIQFHNDV
jgi:hypothetical protein